MSMLTSTDTHKFLRKMEVAIGNHQVDSLFYFLLKICNSDLKNYILDKEVVEICSIYQCPRRDLNTPFLPCRVH